MKRMKHRISTLLAIVLTLTFVFGSAIGTDKTASAGNAGFSIQNGKLIDANGNTFIMKGVNIAHCWYQNDTTTALKAIANTGANTVRVVLADGERWTKTRKEELETILSECEKNKLICMLEIHDATGSNNASTLLNAAKYFVEMKEVLVGKEDTVLINIANEWYGDWTSSAWADGYKQAIPLLRNAGLTHTIVVDAAGWGQYAQSVADCGKEVLAADSLNNTIFSVHMYEYAGGTASTIKTNMDNILNKDLPLIIGEFGYKHTGGDVDEAYLLNYCEEKEVGWCAWSWYGNSGGVEYLDLVTSPASNNYTEFGKIIMEHTYGLPTAKTCSVFTTTAPTNKPTVKPTTAPTNKPTVKPTTAPTVKPTVVPTATPTVKPTAIPTVKPTMTPTVKPTVVPTVQPTATPIPTTTPIVTPKDGFHLAAQVSSWQTGYAANVVISNDTGRTVNGWTLVLKKADFNLSQMWCAKYKVEGDEIIITPEAWNYTVYAGGKIYMGFLGIGSYKKDFTYEVRYE